MRQIVLSTALVLLIVLVGAGRASAQMCSGLPAIGENSKGNVGAALTIGDSLVGIGANVTYGSKNVFGTFELGKVNNTLFEFTSTFVGFTLGGQVPVGRDRPLFICPLASASAEWAGELNQFGLSLSTDIVTGGANIGWVMSGNDRREFVPTIGLTFGQVRNSAVISNPPARETIKSDVGIVTVGVGLIFDKRIAVRPTLSRPFGLDGAGTTFSLLATVAYGRR